MFTIQTAVTIVTAGLASSLFGITDNMVVWRPNYHNWMLCNSFIW